MLDVVPGRSGRVLGSWLADRDQPWKAQIATASLDPFRGYATALATHLPDVIRVLDPFHVVKLGLTCVDEVRRRVQQDTLGHRGFAGDPLFRTRRLLRRRADRLTPRQRTKLIAALDAGDPHGEVSAAWLVAQQLMAAYADPDLSPVRPPRRRPSPPPKTCPVPEINRLGRTLTAWRAEYLAHFDQPKVSNGPTECLNLKIKNTKRDSSRLPVLHQLPSATASQSRNHPQKSPDNTGQIPPTQQDCVEPSKYRAGQTDEPNGSHVSDRIGYPLSSSQKGYAARRVPALRVLRGTRYTESGNAASFTATITKATNKSLIGDPITFWLRDGSTDQFGYLLNATTRTPAYSLQDVADVYIDIKP